MEKVVSFTIGNRPKETRIWVKHDFQQKNVLMGNFAKGGGFDLDKIKDTKEFTPIDGGKSKVFEVQAGGSDIVYLTIVTDAGKIISNGTPKAIDRNIVIMEHLEYRHGINDPSNPFSVETID